MVKMVGVLVRVGNAGGQGVGRAAEAAVVVAQGMESARRMVLVLVLVLL